ncbi:predicted protein [Plenodomus lingam JN3]|uniref:Predicted protein n=1 Tax=Leptosphaeria maculans (strain JN3 / isolate v23.1.3 / race Av1-4-5-6-7-8) TaxID=985895 RepID=E5A9H7_LEPMJ|nr:predicted protein [Plenodomus lingam JN3]CBY00318.1 predicted protein [Plenodomus lingam JN3]
MSQQTSDQYVRLNAKKYQIDGKVLWNAALEDYRVLKEANSTAEGAKNGPARMSEAKEPFPFFRLPDKLRNKVYGYCKLDEREKQVYGRPNGIWSPTCSDFSEGAQDAFDRYQLEHDMYTRQCSHENHDGLDEDESYAYFDQLEKSTMATINTRGNLCDNLLMLSLVNRQLFKETFSLYYSTPREGLWFKWVVRNLDFLPLLRFWQTIARHVEIEPDRLQIQFDTRDQYKSKKMHVEQFENVRRLIEPHWLDGLPLWSCLTGLNEYRNSIGPFGDWTYAIRQIVAVYRVDV